MAWRAGRRTAAIASLAIGLGLVQPSAAEDLRDVTFSVVNNLFATPVYVAAENGYWAKRGLNVTVKLTGSNRAVVHAVRAGDAQFGHAALATTIASARASGNMLTAIVAYYNAADYIAQAGGRAIVARRDRGIHAEDPQSMEGKKIAYLSGSTNELYLAAWFRKHKLDIAKSQLVNMPVETMPVALSQGLVDAIVPWEPYTAQAIRELGANAVVVSRGEEALVADIIGAVANEDWTARNRDTVERFAGGIVEATAFVRRHPRQAVEIAMRYLDGLELKDVSQAMKWLSWDPRMSVCNIEGLMQTGNEMVRAGLVKKDAPFSAKDFYDGTAFNRVVARHPEFFADLPPLPKTPGECKGRLSAGADG